MKHFFTLSIVNSVVAIGCDFHSKSQDEFHCSDWSLLDKLSSCNSCSQTVVWCDVLIGRDFVVCLDCIAKLGGLVHQASFPQLATMVTHDGQYVSLYWIVC